ncbi:unnamed protein product [Ixodes pacificus]
MLISLEMSSLQTDVLIGILVLTQRGPFLLDTLIYMRQESRAILINGYFARTYIRQLCPEKLCTSQPRLVSSVTSWKEGRWGMLRISKFFGPSIARLHSRIDFVSHLSFPSRPFVGRQLAEQWRNGCFETTLTSSAGLLRATV